MKSKRNFIIICALTVMLTVSIFFTTQIIAPKKTEASILDFWLVYANADAKCNLYTANMTGDTFKLAYSDCMEWNLQAYR